MKEKTIGDILGDFGVASTQSKKSLKEGRPVTIWLPAEAKASYDRLQAKSERQFSKKVREALLELILVAEARAS